MQISILQGTANGSAVYVETQTPTTNVNGLVSVEIGAGTTSDDFTSIDWANGPFFIKTETDPSGGTNYSITGTSQLMSVPYALYAKESGSSIPGPAGEDGEDGVGITSTTDNNDGTFTLNFSDGSSFTTADLTGPQGATGATGPQGPTGAPGNDGIDGQDGEDGVGITSTTDNNDGTFTLNFSDGSSFTTTDLTGSQGPQGPAGADGNGIASTTDNGDGTFTITYNDGTTFTTSDLTGPQGVQGPQGNQGPVGATGPQGPAGADGNGIASTTDNGDGTFTITYDDGSTFTTSDLTGPQGATGATGPQGPTGAPGNDGQDGEDGVGITSATDNGDGTFTLNFSDGSSFTTADLTGPQGATGATGPTGPQGPIGAPGNDGIDGQDGEDGVGITSTTDNNDGTFTLNFSDGSVFTTADLTGPQGPAGTVESLASGSILVGDTGNAPTAVSLSGDATLANSGDLTISDDAITTNKLLDASVTDAKLDKTNIPLSGFGAAQTDIDLGSNKILFANVYSSESDLPSASNYHGMFAHVHGTGKAYYAHAGNWVEIANKDELNLAQVLAENNSANNEQIKNLQDPIDAQDAVTKTYVDAISPSPGDNLGDMLYWDGSSWVSIEATQNEGATLQMIGGEPQWVGGTPPPEVPDAPTITSVTPGDGQVDITFDAPTNDGGSTITTYTATSSPGNITGSISQAGSGTITVTGLSNGTAYTFTITATNAVGTSSPSSASNSVTPSSTPQVGDFRDGGVVFYVAPTPTDLDGDGTLDQGLVCAVDDQSSNAEWGCYLTGISGADGTAIGSGAANTSDILADCLQPGIAAELCDDYSAGGYSDWFLPSKDERNVSKQGNY
jgi:hypothetical protein